VLRTLEGAQKALSTLNKNDVVEMKTFMKPPPLVQLTMEAVCILLEVTHGEDRRTEGRMDGQTDGGKSSWRLCLSDFHCQWEALGLVGRKRCAALLQEKSDWENSRRVLSDAHFMKRLVEYSADNIPDQIITALKRIIDDPLFTPEQVHPSEMRILLLAAK
jgi:dynein heavy chain, axonemal